MYQNSGPCFYGEDKEKQTLSKHVHCDASTAWWWWLVRNSPRVFEAYVPTHPSLHHIPCHVIDNRVSNLLSSQVASLQEEFEFPNLESLCADTIREIRTGLLPGASALEYSKAVIDHNGIRAVSRSLVNVISNEVKALQGQVISRAILNTVILRGASRL